MTCPHGERTIWTCRPCQAAYQREYRRIGARRRGRYGRRPVSELRMSEALELAASGLGDKEIAVAMNVSFRTVRSHIERYYVRTGLACRTAAVARWLLSGECTPEQRERVRRSLGLAERVA